MRIYNNEAWGIASDPNSQANINEPEFCLALWKIACTKLGLLLYSTYCISWPLSANISNHLLAFFCPSFS